MSDRDKLRLAVGSAGILILVTGNAGNVAGLIINGWLSLINLIASWLA